MAEFPSHSHLQGCKGPLDVMAAALADQPIAVRRAVCMYSIRQVFCELSRRHDNDVAGCDMGLSGMAIDHEGHIHLPDAAPKNGQGLGRLAPDMAATATTPAAPTRRRADVFQLAATCLALCVPCSMQACIEDFCGATDLCADDVARFNRAWATWHTALYSNRPSIAARFVQFNRLFKEVVEVLDEPTALMLLTALHPRANKRPTAFDAAAAVWVSDMQQEMARNFFKSKRAAAAAQLT